MSNRELYNMNEPFLNSKVSDPALDRSKEDLFPEAFWEEAELMAKKIDTPIKPIVLEDGEIPDVEEFIPETPKSCQVKNSPPVKVSIEGPSNPVGRISLVADPLLVPPVSFADIVHKGSPRAEKLGSIDLYGDLRCLLTGRMCSGLSQVQAMTTVPSQRSSFDVSTLLGHLSNAWRAYAITTTGRLRWGCVLEQYQRGGRLPAAFEAAFKEARPEIQWPQQGTGEGFTGPIDEPRQVAQDGDSNGQPPPENDITNGGTRTFTWVTTTWKKDVDGLNKRKADGSLIPLTEFSREIVENEQSIDLAGAVPPALLTNAMLDHLNALNEINGTVAYDAEKFALGILSHDEYFLVPSNLEVPICEIKDVGGGLSRYDPGMVLVAGVYSLAKAQAIALKYNESDQVKWAALRVEAFRAGWFDHQRYTAYRDMPPNSVRTFLDDGKNCLDALQQAWPLCAFIPFLMEFYFRAYGGSYNQNNAADYTAKAQKLASGANLSNYLNFLPQDILYGKALAWIGVKRPMLVLKNSEASKHVPNVFKIRMSAAPAGQALITTSATIIEALRSAHWWDGITRAGAYNDSILMEVAKEIKADPWKYHLMAYIYELPPLSDDDKGRVEDARKLAQLFAPILQAYVDSVTTNQDIGRAQALKKHAHSNYALYNSALGLFRHVKRIRGKNVAQFFANEVFGYSTGSLEN